MKGCEVFSALKQIGNKEIKNIGNYNLFQNKCQSCMISDISKVLLVFFIYL